MAPKVPSSSKVLSLPPSLLLLLLFMPSSLQTLASPPSKVYIFFVSSLESLPYCNKFLGSFDLTTSPLPSYGHNGDLCACEDATTSLAILFRAGYSSSQPPSLPSPRHRATRKKSHFVHPFCPASRLPLCPHHAYPLRLILSKSESLWTWPKFLWL